MSSPSDAKLLDAWKNGDAAAGSQLVRRHFDSVFRFFRNKVQTEVARDLCQRTFLASLEAKGTFREGTRFRPFILAIARNLLYKHFRNEDRTKTRIERFGRVVPSTPTSPSGNVARNEEQSLLLEALRALPLEQQLTIELHYWEELTTSEIAEVLGVPSGTVKWRLSRAREALRALIDASSASGEVRASTLGNLDGWARSLRVRRALARRE